ncbi:MNN9 [Mytilus edulis]|uniref:MNN9 n=1 Tax=Mytilus edulis TaxID=6550 RepID=A0A8S3UBA7_MYTED|nr:MNN9 [Mytilus edulis]
MTLHRKLKNSYKKFILTPYIPIILILTRSIIEKTLFRFPREICELKYDHALIISIAFGEDGSTDGTIEKAKLIIDELKASGFRNISFYHFDIDKQVSGDWRNIHQRNQQYKRRQHLAKARNLLLKNALSDQDYVLWIDSDIGDLPQDIIQQLLFAKKDIVNPSCLFKQGRTVRNYDKNLWRETPLSLEKQMKMPANYLVIEGYGSTSRIYLPDLRGEGRIVPLNCVGGCTLLVQATCHREGLDFPETLFDHHIETEGLAKKAKTMGYSVYGMPFVEVFHF